MLSDEGSGAQRTASPTMAAYAYALFRGRGDTSSRGLADMLRMLSASMSTAMNQ